MAGGPFARFEWMLAARYLRPRKKEGFISVIAGFSFLGIALGVATLIIVMAVMNGFRGELLGRILGLNGHFVIQGVTGPLTDFDQLVQRIETVPGVASATPFIEGQAMVTARENTSGVLVRGLRKQNLEQLSVVSKHIKSGSLDDFAGDNGVLIGTRLAERLGVGVGDQLTLLSANGPTTPFGTAPRVKSYSILGTFEIGMSEYDASFLFMPLEEAQLYFNFEAGVSGIEIMVANPDDIARYRSEIAGCVNVPARLTDWQQQNKTFFDALEVERNVMFLILTLIILVAALNIISGLIMLVKDKGQAIAILRTMGASRGAIMRVFLIAGSTIGVVGTLGGFALGVVFCQNIEAIRQFLMHITGQEIFSPEVYFLSQIPAKMNSHEVALVVVMALSLSVLATIYPSWRAARLDPIEALRYE